jgi:endoglucanase
MFGIWMLFSCTGATADGNSGCDTGTTEPETHDTGTEPQDSGTDTQETGEPHDTTDTEPPPEWTETREMLQAATRFYGAQRCGDTDNWLIADHELGGTCHLQDGPQLRSGIDLTGGWHDAGDHIKPTLTIAYSAYVMLKALEVWPDAFDDLDDGSYTGAANGLPDVLDELIVALDYLAKVQVGGELVVMVSGEEDHNVFVTSPYQSTLRVNQGGGERNIVVGGKSDVAGILAAALALGSTQIRSFDSARADTWLQLARTAMSWGESHPGGSTADFYTGSDPQANLLAGAAELYRATGEESYLTAALGYDTQVGQHYWVPLWDNPSDYARHSLVAAGQNQVLTNWTRAVQSYLNAVSTNSNVAGLSWFYDWGTLAVATHTAASAGLLFEITGETAYEDFARSQVAWVLGENPYGRSFVVGVGTDPPRYPHHANGYGHDDLNTDWDLEPLHTLTGALVGGPTSAVVQGFPAGYQDDLEDYVGNEVTLDYNAGLVAAGAFAVSRGD